tara:strand:- start:125 stop:250 length:126 start_codon:yes stop_codon:yes gene_type:complete
MSKPNKKDIDDAIKINKRLFKKWVKTLNEDLKEISKSLERK